MSTEQPSAENPPAACSARDLAEAVWRAGVASVDSRRLVREAIAIDGSTLTVAGRPHAVAEFDRVLVLGAGKAGGGMVQGVEDVLAGSVSLSGHVNVPADCVVATGPVRLHAGRPAGVNEPRPEGVAGTRRMLELARAADARTLVIVLISGGGSALLVDPTVSLKAKQAVTRMLAKAGAPIQELNAVRTRLSRVKGGGLARALAGAGAVETLVISDVIGDPLDVIASGPTVLPAAEPDTRRQPVDILRRYVPDERQWPEDTGEALEAAPPAGPAADVRHTLIGTNATAVAAAAAEAERRGYAVVSLGPGHGGEAAGVGRTWAARIAEAAPDGPPTVMLDGGEPTVEVGAAGGKGGRNQELVLAAVDRLWHNHRTDWALLSGGTDGEDGPTDAAGAVADADLIRRALASGLEPDPFLTRHDSYTFFDACDGLLKTGPTHTNVMDLRVAVVGWP